MISITKFGHIVASQGIIGVDLATRLPNLSYRLSDSDVLVGSSWRLDGMPSFATILMLRITSLFALNRYVHIIPQRAHLYCR